MSINFTKSEPFPTDTELRDTLPHCPREPVLERAAGIEPASSAWKAEVLPLNYARKPFYLLTLPAPKQTLTNTLPGITRRKLVEGAGFEPAKAEPSDLQSDPFGHSGTPPKHDVNR